MDQSGADVESETEGPQDQQDYDDCPKHLVSPERDPGKPRRDLPIQMRNERPAARGVPALRQVSTMPRVCGEYPLPESRGRRPARNLVFRPMFANWPIIFPGSQEPATKTDPGLKCSRCDAANLYLSRQSRSGTICVRDRISGHCPIPWARREYHEDPQYSCHGRPRHCRARRQHKRQRAEL